MCFGFPRQGMDGDRRIVPNVCSARLKLLNKEDNDFFSYTGKGLGQGDPLSPLLLNLIVDAFSGMLLKGSQASLISGVIS
jgi:hypothetical protein